LTIQGSAQPHLPDLKGLEALLDIFSLCNILILSNILDERTYWPSNTGAIPLDEHYTCAYARGLSLCLLDALDQLFTLVTVGPSGSEVTNDFTSIRTIAAKFLAQQSAAILDYKRRAEQSGMQGATHHCTSSKLRQQLEGCLALWPECAEAFQICMKAAKKSMEWVSDCRYQLLPKPFVPFEGSLYALA